MTLEQEGHTGHEGFFLLDENLVSFASFVVMVSLT